MTIDLDDTVELDEQYSDDQDMQADVMDAIIRIEALLERRKEKESRLDRQRRISQN